MRILGLTVQNVRGLPDLQLNLDGKNLVIWGPNGAGKSCVVDAIDFLFTGSISRLLGEGTAGITLARHGHHVDHDAESALVRASVQLEGLLEPIEITRCMARPDQLECPDDARAALSNVSDLMSKGGVTLTRRDILRYVAAEAAKRANQVQELLHLEDIKSVRSSLRGATTELARIESDAHKAIQTARADVNVTLNMTDYSDEGLFEVVNTSRQTLGGGLLQVHGSAGFKEGLAPPAPREEGQSSANLNLFHQALQNVRQGTQSTIEPVLNLSDEHLRKNITKLKANPTLLAELEGLELTEHAAHFVEDSTIECPVCQTPWPAGLLKSHLEDRIATAHAAKVVRNEIFASAEALAMPARALSANVKALKESLMAAKVETKDEDIQFIDTWLKDLNDLLTALANPVEQYLDRGFSNDVFARVFLPEGQNDLLGRIEKTVQEALPKPTPEQTAWDTLTQLEVSGRALEHRTQEKEVASLHSTRSKLLLTAYEKARDIILEDLYSRIANRFVEFYHVLHTHESDDFGARLLPKGAALAFEVDFLGRGTHPPNALHSEGHQDSMGLCLFLSLNEELAKGNLGLIVLDDVMMSVDTGHRKEVCRLLNEQFANTQFVITTHDRTWAKQLRQEGVVERSQVIEFTGWTVERGPQTSLQVDLWEAIQADLDRDNIPEAAFKLRRGSEDFFESACDSLRAEVIYNSEMQWQLDDWLLAAMNQYKDLLKRGRRAALSWGATNTVAILDEKESIRKQVYRRTFVEQWAINGSVHFNNWENMSKQDFTPVADAFRDLQALFECSDCGGLLQRLPSKGPLNSVKCRCGNVNWNLQHKPDAS